MDRATSEMCGRDHTAASAAAAAAAASVCLFAAASRRPRSFFPRADGSGPPFLRADRAGTRLGRKGDSIAPCGRPTAAHARARTQHHE